MRNLLREFGFDPVTANSGEQALAELRRQTPDLVLLDADHGHAVVSGGDGFNTGEVGVVYRWGSGARRP